MQNRPRTLAAIAAASLLATFAAQANKGAEYKPHHHKEHYKSHFLTAGATYLEPSFSGLDYIGVSTQDKPDTPVYLSAENVEPGFDWGYFIQGGYRISHHYDVQASWSQYNSRLSDSTTILGSDTVDVGGITSNDFTLSGLPGGAEAVAQAWQSLNYSMFDANLGQYHDITEMLRARIFAGVRYAQVDGDFKNLYTVNLTPIAYHDEYHSAFDGVGPEIGLDLEYKIWHTFGVVGHLAGAFLVGQLEASSYVYNDGFNAQLTNEADKVTRLVPALDAKLGLNWNVPYAYEHCSFGIEGGYQVAYYWNVIDQIQNPGYANQIVHNYANYGNMGPYLNFTALF